VTDRASAADREPLATDPERLAALFLELTSIASPSRHERPIADFVRARLEDWGLVVREDEAGVALSADAGNLLCRVVPRGHSGDADTRPTIALAAHMDTVAPTDELLPVLEDGIFRNQRPTILGADDKTAVAALLHATDILFESGEPFAPFELLFTICEELGLQGAKQLGDGWPASPLAAIFDAGGSVGGMVVGAPSQITWKATFTGKAAHAGMEPEKGRNAVLAASKAIAAMELGRLDEQTTANVGFIEGGAATNIVPERCVVKGECRSHDDARLTAVAARMVDALQMGATEIGVDVDIDMATEYRSFALTGRSPVVRLAKRAFTALGIDATMVSAGGGSDANILNERGIPTVNLACGMTGVHAAGETQSLDDLVASAAVALALIREAGRS
jgi:tripeptide aminopeptidase